MLTEDVLIENDVISFKYKGSRHVKGKIISVDKNGLLIKLFTDYLGKNEDWYSGE